MENHTLKLLQYIYNIDETKAEECFDSITADMQSKRKFLHSFFNKLSLRKVSLDTPIKKVDVVAKIDDLREGNFEGVDNYTERTNQEEFLAFLNRAFKDQTLSYSVEEVVRLFSKQFTKRYKSAQQDSVKDLLNLLSMNETELQSTLALPVDDALYKKAASDRYLGANVRQSFDLSPRELDTLFSNDLLTERDISEYVCVETLLTSNLGIRLRDLRKYFDEALANHNIALLTSFFLSDTFLKNNSFIVDSIALFLTNKYASAGQITVLMLIVYHIDEGLLGQYLKIKGLFNPDFMKDYSDEVSSILIQSTNVQNKLLERLDNTTEESLETFYNNARVPFIDVALKSQAFVDRIHSLISVMKEGNRIQCVQKSRTFFQVTVNMKNALVESAMHKLGQNLQTKKYSPLLKELKKLHYLSFVNIVEDFNLIEKIESCLDQGGAVNLLIAQLPPNSLAYLLNQSARIVTSVSNHEVQNEFRSSFMLDILRVILNSDVEVLNVDVIKSIVSPHIDFLESSLPEDDISLFADLFEQLLAKDNFDEIYALYSSFNSPEKVFGISLLNSYRQQFVCEFEKRGIAIPVLKDEGNSPFLCKKDCSSINKVILPRLSFQCADLEIITIELKKSRIKIESNTDSTTPENRVVTTNSYIPSQTTTKRIPCTPDKQWFNPLGANLWAQFNTVQLFVQPIVVVIKHGVKKAYLGKPNLNIAFRQRIQNFLNLFVFIPLVTTNPWICLGALGVSISAQQLYSYTYGKEKDVCVANDDIVIQQHDPSSESNTKDSAETPVNVYNISTEDQDNTSNVDYDHETPDNYLVACPDTEICIQVEGDDPTACSVGDLVCLPEVSTAGSTPEPVGLE